MASWTVKFDVWAYSTGEGASIDQKKVGDKTQTFQFMANEIEDALEKANLIKKGIKTNPSVWTCRIKSLKQTSD